MNEFKATWAMEPVCDVEKISLEALSLGIEGSLLGAASFGGFLKRTTSLGEVFGITAAHCLPGATTGIPICSPSTIEVMGRFNRLLRYTTICPPTDRLHLNPLNETETKSLLERFRFQASTYGTPFLNPANQYQLEKGVLSGGRIGAIVSHQFGDHKELLHSYDQELQKLTLPKFSAARSWETRMD
ncbi:hypothetical protein L873DRAFT_979566 [Choiromyces venosus 120613-1]|uniref:Uncharacterized protein n=1 Tax=Choiromyces venosus 120613-1 TaxID=1336337 RepID=A0A3N4JP50_9PEZI|nr:hypothetical protein L873DRAFT_979566 [Choiromyces venosus 120613-1]